jgi:hypothetical protein
MECKIISRAGQTLARGRLFLEREPDGLMRLNFQTNKGTLIKGGLVSDDGDLRNASDELFDNCYKYWRMSDLTLSINLR